MLVQSLDKSEAATLGPADFAAGVTVQRKLNGVRVVAHLLEDGAVELYSRTGKIYVVDPELTAEVARLLRTRADNPYFDGELYVHGKSLAWISGQARKTVDDAQLQIHFYDVFFPSAPAVASRDRQKYLDAAFAAAGPFARLYRVENIKAHNRDDLARYAKQFVAEKYEGAIARKDSAPYQYGIGNYHSPNLVKIKPTHDAEYPVVGFSQGRGTAAGAVIWQCSVPGTEETFSVVPAMGIAERRRIYACLAADSGRFDRDVRGRMLTVAFSELSEDRVPQQPRGLAFRTYEDRGRDPIAELYGECGIV